MNCKEKLEQYLREHKVPFTVHHHPVAYTAQELAESEHVTGKAVAKVVMVFAGGKMMMLALPASHQVDLQRAHELFGELRLAKEDEFDPVFPDCEVGAMPPFGNLYGLTVFVDRSLADDESILFQAGTHTDTISMKYSDFERLVHPVEADFARAA
ncbi:MAG TPA: YbaK/EbsC family protein [Dehalococcoidia bacterium]|nr:YbaK/EbsC family protein [Dehalococcoidia bacterium]